MEGDGKQQALSRVCVGRFAGDVAAQSRVMVVLRVVLEESLRAGRRGRGVGRVRCGGGFYLPWNRSELSE